MLSLLLCNKIVSAQRSPSSTFANWLAAAVTPPATPTPHRGHRAQFSVLFTVLLFIEFRAASNDEPLRGQLDSLRAKFSNHGTSHVSRPHGYWHSVGDPAFEIQRH